MPRPRKNRLAEYSGLLGEELAHQLKAELTRTLAEHQKLYLEEIAKLRSEIRTLRRAMDELKSRVRSSGKPAAGKWVPGGPGRPPKDADARIAAFETRKKTRARPKSAKASRGKNLP